MEFRKASTKKSKKEKISVPEELWVYSYGYPDLVNELLLYPFPRKRWNALKEDILKELQRRAEAHGTPPEFELVKAARGSLSLVLSRGFETKVSGDLDRDNTILKRALRKKVSYEICKDLLGDHYWRPPPPSRDVGQGLKEPLDMEDEQGKDISKLLKASGLSKLEKRFAAQLRRSRSAAEASRRLKISPSTGRTLLERIRKKVAKFTGTVSK
ncbi:hypothetical protein MYX76_09630 [Desulfobacterota bacterium AH_259_B03_O07]|nr:hypothetical protein [Desulfobacterota bacterium AH_259_B03_O07]